MSYIRMSDQKYPYTLAMYKKDNPGVVVPRTPKPEWYVNAGMAPVAKTARPEYDPLTQRLELTVVLDGGAYRQNWQIVALSQAEADGRLAAHIATRTREIQDALQQRLDEFAQTRGYDSIMSAATYATGSNAQFQPEGQYCVDIREQTWAQAYAILDDFEAGNRGMPTVEEVLAEVAAPAWPQ
ncbi:MAG: hypothetical protein R3221_06395 [Spongiibacter sp.]|nr:hypothetical protein [Spongiibacter sp.]